MERVEDVGAGSLNGGMTVGEFGIICGGANEPILLVRQQDWRRGYYGHGVACFCFFLCFLVIIFDIVVQVVKYLVSKK